MGQARIRVMGKDLVIENSLWQFLFVPLDGHGFDMGLTWG